MKAKIVVADDEPRIRAMIALLLKEDGYKPPRTDKRP